MKNFSFNLVQYYKQLLPSQNVSEDFALRRIVLIISILSAVSSILAMSISLILKLSSIYITCAAFITVLFIGNIIIALFSSTFYSKLYYSLVTPLWYNVNIILLGGGFGEGAAWMTNLAFAYIFFKNHKYKRPILTYMILFFLLSIIYVDIAGPIVGYINLPFDSVLTVLVAAVWLMLIFEMYNSEKEDLIVDLQKKNKQLNATTEELEQFTYIASHDLKTPLRNVTSFLDIIERKVKNKEYEEILEDIQFAKKGGKQMYSLVTEILEMTKVRHELNTGYENVELNQVINKVSAEVLKQYPEVHIDNRLSHNYVANEAHFYILIQNLILNGIKYNQSEKPQISLWDESHEDSLSIYVKDNGIGIDEEFHEQIFEFFKRLHSNFKYEGTGLGLGLCKKIVESYNGSITVSSVVGEGSTFTISLPR